MFSKKIQVDILKSRAVLSPGFVPALTFLSSPSASTFFLLLFLAAFPLGRWPPFLVNLRTSLSFAVGRGIWSPCFDILTLLFCSSFSRGVCAYISPVGELSGPTIRTVKKKFVLIFSVAVD
jgi:polyferredoxin